MRIVIAAAALMASVGMTLAQPADLVTAYRAGVAAEKCELGLEPARSSQLGDAVQRAEQRSGLAQSDLDALWARVQAEADADLAGFCAGAAALVDQAVATSG